MSNKKSRSSYSFFGDNTLNNGGVNKNFNVIIKPSISSGNENEKLRRGKIDKLQAAIDSIQPFQSSNKNRQFTVLRRFWKAVPVFDNCLKWHFSISFPEVMVGMFDFLLVRRSILGKGLQIISKKLDINSISFVPYSFQLPITYIGNC